MEPRHQERPPQARLPPPQEQEAPPRRLPGHPPQPSWGSQELEHQANEGYMLTVDALPEGRGAHGGGSHQQDHH